MINCLYNIVRLIYVFSLITNVIKSKTIRIFYIKYKCLEIIIKKKVSFDYLNPISKN